MFYIVVLAIALLSLPFFIQKTIKHWKIDHILSDVVACYIVGIIFASTKNYWWPTEGLDTSFQLSKNFAEASVLLAIPILLMINPARQWLAYTGEMLKTFMLITFCVTLWSAFMGWYNYSSLGESDIAAGMLAGVFIGGTPNMVAVHKGLGGSENLFVMASASDTLCSGLYLVFLMGVGRRFFGSFLKTKEEINNTKEINSTIEKTKKLEQNHYLFSSWQAAWRVTLWAILMVALSVVLGSLFPDDKGEPNQLIVMLALSTLGIFASFSNKITALKPSEPWAHYLLLIFAISAGSLADFGEVMLKGGAYVRFTALLLMGCLAIFFFLAWLLRIDRDTSIIASTAAIFGSPFVSQVGVAIKSESLIPAGIAMGVLGLAIGNYMGVICVILVNWLV